MIIHKVHSVFFGIASLLLVSVTVTHAEHSPGPSDVMKMDSATEADKHVFKSDDDKQRTTDHGKPGVQTGEVKTIKGQLTRIKDGNYFVKTSDGNTVRFRTDKHTNMVGRINKGDEIEAMVNDQNHALSIRSIK